MFPSLRYLEDPVKLSVFKVTMHIEYAFLKVNKTTWQESVDQIMFESKTEIYNTNYVLFVKPRNIKGFLKRVKNKKIIMFNFFWGVGCCEIMFTLVIFVSEKDGSKIFLKISFVYLVSSFVCLFCMFAVCLFVSGLPLTLTLAVSLSVV